MKKLAYLRFERLRFITVVMGLLSYISLFAIPAQAQEFTARHLGDYGNVTVMEGEGYFDELQPDGTENIVARQNIAKEFFHTHKDEYDTVAIFTNFDFKMRPDGRIAYYSHVKNDVKGIGQQIYDNSKDYGSNGRLFGTIDMGNYLKLNSNPLDPKFDFTIDTLIHETLHRSAAFVKFKDWNGTVSDALLGQDKAHWSFLLDSAGSTLYGNKWMINGDGTFTSTAVRKYYSPLDLYVMGMIDKSKVPPTLLIDNPAIDPAKMPEIGDTISGTAHFVTIDDIIAAEGERIPSAKDSQKQFKMAFIYVVSPGTFKSDDLYGIENLRNAYLTRFSILTDGKGLVQVASTPKDNLATNPGVRPPSSTPRTLPPSIDNGVSWLMNSQQKDGSWTDYSLTTERDTTETVTTLQHFPVSVQSFQAGVAWLGNNPSANTDFLTRRIEAAVQAGGDSSALVQELLARRNSDGGWGSNHSFMSTSTDTALALKALAVAGYSDSTVTGHAIVFLQRTQNADGGWSGDDAFSTIQPTAAVLTAFNSYRKNIALDTNLTKAVAFLASKQNPDGGFGNSPSTVYDSALAVIALQAAGADKTLSGRGVSYLLGQQSENGAWFDSPYQTALAVKAVWAATVDPDLSIKPEDISVIPTTVTTLPTNAVLSATVWNLGRNDVPQAKVAVYDGLVTPDKKIAEQVAAFLGQSPVTLTFSIPVTDCKGHVFHVVADPDNQLVESNKNNNSALKSLQPDITYDFQVQASDIAVTPNLANIFQDVKISVKVANRGTSDAYNVPVRLFIDQPGAPLEIAQLTVDIPAGGTVSRDLTWRASLAGVNLPLTVQIDPNNTFTETNKDNNRVSVPLTVNASTLPNLSVSYKDMVITPSPAREGGSTSISVLVKNDGFSLAENVKVNVYRGVASNGGVLLGSQIIPAIATGQSVRTSIDWNGIAVNGGQIITALVDPDSAIQEITKDDNFTFSSLDVLSLPDLAISTSSVAINPATPKSGDTVTVAVTVQNGGEQEARDVSVQVKEGGTVIGSTVIPLVNGNSQATGTISYVNAGQTGTHQVTVTVDPGNLIVERTKDNNSAVKTFSIQDANLWLTEPYISPNGDGIKDSTDFSFRLAAPAKVSVQVVNKKGVAVRTFSGGELDNSAGATITWDGKNDAGAVVDDGTYQIKVINASNTMLASLPVEVDTNRSLLVEAIGTSYILKNNLTLKIPNVEFIKYFPDESGILVYVPGNSEGIYKATPFGDNLLRIIPLKWSDTKYDYSVESFEDISPDGLNIALVVDIWNRTTKNHNSSLWLVDSNGVNLQQLVISPNIKIKNWSPDSKYLIYSTGPVSYSGINAEEMWLIDKQATVRTKLDLTYSNNVEWSPDSQRIAYPTNISCNSDFSQCTQNSQVMLKTSDLIGNKEALFTSDNDYFNTLHWLNNGNIVLENNSEIWVVARDESNGNIKVADSSSGIYGGLGRITFSPANRSFAFVTAENAEANLNISDETGKKSTAYSLPRLQDPYMFYEPMINEKIVWSPDGKRIAFLEAQVAFGGRVVQDNRLSIINLNTGGKVSFPYTGNASQPSNELSKWLADGVSIMGDMWEGSFIANSVSGEITDLNGYSNLSPQEKLIISSIPTDPTCSPTNYTSCTYNLWGSISLLNLTAELGITKNKSVVKLGGIAADKNFAGYKLEYADIKTPDVWSLIMPPSDVPVVNDIFTYWVPPTEGSFYVRLTVWDKAGSVATARQRVAWGISSTITNLYKSSEIFSPNGDGINDSVSLNYKVLEPIHLEFTISDETGSVVRRFTKDYTEPKNDFITWDGRNEAGIVAPDGKYSIKILDYEFSVTVDRTPPDVGTTLSLITASAFSYENKMNGVAFNQKDFMVTLTGHARDINFKQWSLLYGEEENPKEWSELSHDTTQLSDTDDSRKLVEKQISSYRLSLRDNNGGGRYHIDSNTLDWLVGKSLRVDGEDYAGNKKTVISGLLEEKIGLILWDDQLIPAMESDKSEYIWAFWMRPGRYHLQALETVRNPDTRFNLQYSVYDVTTKKEVWHDYPAPGVSESGIISLDWDRSKITAHISALRFKGVDSNGEEYFSKRYPAEEEFDVEKCGGYVLNFPQNPDTTNILGFQLQSEEDSRYRNWTTIKVYVAAKGDTVEGVISLDKYLDLFKPGLILNGKKYFLRAIKTTYDGKQIISSGVVLGCPAEIPKPSYKLTVTYPEGDCGATQKQARLDLEKTDTLNYFTEKSKEFYLQKPEGLQLIGQMDQTHSSNITIDTTVLAEGNYLVKGIVRYLNNNDFYDGIEKVIELNSILVVDRVPPSARITYPADSSLVLCPVQINEPEGPWFVIPPEGVAKDNAGVKTYELFYGEGDNPATWFPAETLERDKLRHLTRNPIVGVGALQGTIGKWNITDKGGDQNYVLKLKVTDIAGNVSCTTSAPITVDKAVDIPVLKQDKGIFSPNGDGMFDNANVSYEIDKYAQVDVKVFKLIENLNSPPILDATPVRTIISGQTHISGTEYTTWDGKGDSGSVLPDGRYGTAVFATDACGNSNRKWLPIEVDNTPPTVEISFPRPIDPLPPGVMIEIKGSTADLHFKSYLLEAGEGDNPTTWKTLAASDKPVSSAVIAPWNTFGMKDRWTLRLTAEDLAGNKKAVTSTIDLGIRKELVKSLSATPKLFSPNNDQKLDTSLISYEVTDACNVKLDILDGNGQVVRTFTAVTTAAGKGSFVWDGKNSLGSTVTDGGYAVRLTASLTAKPEVNQTETISLTVDTTPPAITITDLIDKSYLNRTDLSIAGTNFDANLVSYNITIAGPSGTTTLDTGTQNRANYTFGRITDLAEDTYSLTVNVNDQGENQTKLVRTFTIDRTPPKVALDAPKSGEYYGNINNVFEISGSINEKNLDRYSLRYGTGETPTEWKEVVGGDTVPTTSKLSSLKVGKSDGLADGVYTLSLFAKDKAGLEGEARTKIIIDNTPPQVVITSPKHGDYLIKALDIKGTAADTYFDYGTLDLAEGACASAVKWAVIKTLNAAVQDGILDSWKLLPADGEYCLRLSAIDKSGNKSETKTGIKIDTHPPAAPQLTGKIDNKVDVVLSWTKNTEPDLAGYNIYRSNQRINTTLLTTLTYRDPFLKEGAYSYIVKAVDIAGNESDPSNAITLKVDLVGPSVRISSPGDGAVVSNIIDIKGTANSQDDFKEYRIYIGQGSSPSSWTQIRRSPLPISFGSLAQWDTITSQDGAQFIIKLEGEDLSGNISTTQAIITIDNTPPKAPVLLTTVATGADVALTWNANIETDLAGYLLYRNDQLANVKGIVAGNLKPYLLTGTGYTDKSLADGTYRYYLIAMDQAGNSSDQSNTLEVTIDTHPPHMTITEPANGQKFDGKLAIKAETPDNDIATVQFRYKRLQDSSWLNLGSPFSKAPYIAYFDPNALNLSIGDYQIQALAMDQHNKVDLSPEVVTVNYIDLPPAVPSGLAVKVTGSVVILTWNANTESDLASYNIYRWSIGSKTKVNGNPVTAATFKDNSVPDGIYQYEVTAVDRSGNESTASGQVAAKVYAPVIRQVFTPVKYPAAIIDGVGAEANSSVEITTHSPSGQSTKTTVSSDMSGYFRQEGVTLALGENRVSAIATDSTGNVSRSSAQVVVAYGVQPAAPTGLNVAVQNYDVQLSWNSNSEPDIIGYNLFRDGNKVNAPVAVTGGISSASYEDNDLNAQHAIDGNDETFWGIPSGDGNFTPAWWEISIPEPTLINRVNIRWGLGNWDNANNRYNIFAGKDYEIQAWSGYGWITLKTVSGNDQQINTIDITPSYRTDRLRVAIASTTDQESSKYVRISEIRFEKDNLVQSPAYSEIGLKDGRFIYTVTAVNSYGFESEPSSPVEGDVGDVSPPAAPNNLNAMSQGSNILLDWSITPNTESDLAGYIIYRQNDQGSWDYLADVHVSVTTYMDSMLPNATYSYGISAYDNVGNESDLSNIASASVAVAPPPAPMTVMITAPPEGKTLVASWQQTGGTTAAYNLYRSIAQGGPYQRITSSPIQTVTYRDAGLLNGTQYFYVVTALDTLGNEGSYSNEGNGMPSDLVAPDRPLIFAPTQPGKPLTVYQNNVAVSGAAEPGSLVEFMRGTDSLGTAVTLAEDSHTTKTIDVDGNSRVMSPNGAMLAYSDYYGVLWLKDLSTGSLTYVADSGWDAVWSPDGRRIAYVAYDPSWNPRIMVYTLEMSKSSFLTDDPGVNESLPCWSGDGMRIAFSSNRNGTYGVWLKNLIDNSLVQLVDNINVSKLSLSPDASKIAYFNNQNLFLINIADGKASQLDDNADQSAIAWAHDNGKVVFISQRDGAAGMFVTDLTTMVANKILGYSGSGFSQPAWSPDGTRLVYSQDESYGSSLHIIGLNGEKASLLDNLGGINPLRWAQGGEITFIEGNSIHFVNLKGTFTVPNVQLIAGENQIYAVASDDSGNVSPLSDSIMVMTNRVPPAAPANLKATTQGSTVLLDWSLTPNTEPALAGYTIYRQNDQDWVRLGDVPASITTYTDTTLHNDTYSYHITARDQVGNESDPSNNVSVSIAFIPLPVPLGLTITAPPEGKTLVASWQQTGGTTAAYNLYRSIAQGGPYQRITSSPIQTVTYRDAGLLNGTRYFYVVTALDTLGNEGSYSNEGNGMPRDLVTPDRPLIFAPTQPGKPLTVCQNNVSVSGIAEPGSIVEFMRGADILGSAVTLAEDSQTTKAINAVGSNKALSPDGAMLVYRDNNGTLQLKNLATGTLTNVADNGLSAVWSPDGRKIAYIAYPRIKVYDLDTAKSTFLTDDTGVNENMQSWSGDGTRIAFRSNRSGAYGVWLKNLSDYSLIKVANNVNVSKLSVSPDASNIAYFSYQNLFLINIADGKVIQLDSNTDQSSIAWAPDSSKVAFVSYRNGDTSLFVNDLTSQATSKVLGPLGNGFSQPSWSPDGTKIIYRQYEDYVASLHTIGLSSEKTTLLGNLGSIDSLGWAKDGTIAFIDGNLAHSLKQKGTFTISKVQLVAGENKLYAVAADASGNASPPSDSITVVFDTGLLPDLAITGSGISLFPPYPKPGEDVLVTARVHNPTNIALDNATVELYLWDGSSDIKLLKSEIIQHLDANGEGSVTVRFNAGTTIGTHTIIAVADPSNLIAEVSETNNYATRDLVITDQERLSVSTSLSSSSYGANQDATIGVTLMNSGTATSGTLNVMIEDSNGNLVKLLSSQPQELPYGLDQKLAFTWNTGATYMGSYKVHALLIDSTGTATLAENATPFSILPDLKASGTVTTDKKVYGSGEPVGVNVAFNNSGANYVIPQLKARVRIVDAQNTQISSEEKTFTNLLPTMGGSFSSTWNTGLSSAGAYTAVIDLSVGDQVLISKSAIFNILPQPLLKGTLSVDTAVVLTGRSFTSTYNVSNLGNSAAAGTVRITVQDPDTQMIVASSEQPAGIQVNGSMPGSARFDTTGLALKIYQVVLWFKTDTTWQNIAMATIAVKDGIPPAITIVSPHEGMSFTKEVTLSVIAIDDASGVDRVEYSLDGGAWKIQPLADPANGRYSVVWTPTVTDNGVHTTSFRGIDRTGNTSQPVSVAFISQIDTIPPVLSVSTLADGSYTNNSVLNISGTVTDNVGVKDLLINSVSVAVNADSTFSYAFVLATGTNRIEVIATDQANNTTSDIRTIYLDQKVPILIVTSPADNSKTGTALTQVSGTIDETSTVVVKVGGISQPVELSAAAFTAGVYLVPGSNTIEITATDLAGNQSSVKRTVIFDDQKPSLAVTDPSQDIRTNKANLTIKGTATDPYTNVSISIAMDGQIYTPPVVNGVFEQAVTFTTEKSYSIVVTATNEVETATSVQRNVIYDITPPVLSIDPVISPTNQASRNVSGTMETGAAVTVAGSSATVGSVTYPTATTWRATVGSFTSETNLISVTATDAVGNVSTATSTIIYDTTSPAGMITINNGAVITGSPQVLLTLSANDTNGVSQMQFSSDGANWTDSEAFASVRGWFLVAGDGVKKVYVRFRDQAGNWSDAISAEIVLDTTVPAVSATPAGGIFAVAQSIVLAATEQAIIYYTTDGLIPTTTSQVYSSPLPVTASSTIKYFAKDQAGNSSEVKTDSYIIDLAAPVLSVSTLSDGTFTNHDTLNITGTVHDDNGVGSLLVNGINLSFAADGSFSYALLLKSGANLVNITATDLVGNKVQNTRTISLDLDAPVLTVTSPVDNSKTASMSALVTGTVGENSTIVVNLNTLSQQVTITGMSYSSTLSLVPGLNTIEIKATDLAGNQSSKKRSVIYDNQTPSLAVTDPAQDIRTNQGTHVIKGTASDIWSSVIVTITNDGVTYSPALVNGSFEQAVAFPTEKTYPIKVTATNEVGTVSSVQRNIIFDITKPALTINPVTSPTTLTSQVITGTRESGVAVTITCTTAGVGSISYPTDTSWSAMVTNLQTGDNLINVTAADAAGNVSQATAKITFATNPPVSTFAFALFGNKSITMTGGSYVDSYIGSPASYVRGQYKKGDIGTNSLLPCSIQLTGGVQVFGKGWVGAGGNPVAGICVIGGSSIYNNLTGALAAMKDMTSKPDPGGGTFMGVLNLSNGVKSTLTAGDYRYTSMNLTGGSTLTLNGAITLHIDGNLTISNGSKMVIASGAATLYANGQKIDITGGTLVNSTQDPRNMTIYGGTGLLTVNLSGGSNLHAQVFAPAAAIKISGGQNTFGALIGNTIDLSNGSSVHFNGN